MSSIFIICWLVSEGPPAAPGSTRAHCLRCTHEVCISPASTKLRARTAGIALMCMPCFSAETKGKPQPVKVIAAGAAERVALDAIRSSRERN